MTMIHRRAARVRSTLSVAAGLMLAACGGSSDSTGPEPTPDNGLLAPGQSATLNGTKTLTLEGGSTGTENVLVVVDTGITAVSAKATYQVATTGTGAAGVVSAPATALVPLTETSASRGAEPERSGDRHRLRDAAQRPKPGTIRHRVPRRALGIPLRHRATGRHVAKRRRRRCTGRRHLHAERQHERVQSLPDSRRARRGDRHAVDRAVGHAESGRRVHHGRLSAVRGALRHARVPASTSRTSAPRPTSTRIRRSYCCSRRR